MIENINLDIDSNMAEIEDIKRCLNALYGTRAGSVPMDREFGISDESVDMPLPVAKNLLAVEIMEKTERYEPRVEVTGVTYTTENGSMIATVSIARAEASEEVFEEEKEDNIDEGEDDE